jgi:hypothetical protein
MEKLQKPSKTDTVSYHHQKHLEMIYFTKIFNVPWSLQVNS